MREYWFETPAPARGIKCAHEGEMLRRALQMRNGRMLTYDRTLDGHMFLVRDEYVDSDGEVIERVAAPTLGMRLTQFVNHRGGDRRQRRGRPRRAVS